MMPGAFDVNTAAPQWLQSDLCHQLGGPERGQQRAKQAPCRRHVNNFAENADEKLVAFFDRASIARDHDTDIGPFRVQSHALNTPGKFDHFAGPDIVQAVNGGNHERSRTDGEERPTSESFGFFGRKS